MKEWLVDTNVLLDVLGADTTFGERSRMVLLQCAQEGVLIINPIVLAEVSALLGSLEELETLLPESLFRRDPIPAAASFLAGQAFKRYKQRGGTKGRMLADFLIGAHAAVAGFGLMTRDEGYGAYFAVELLNPAKPAG
jgi:predicted nucleic acid-binding protein